MQKINQTVQESVYDHPSYYDVLFNSTWKREYDFLLYAFRKLSPIPVNRVFEPACGTGRLLWRLAKDGFDVSGLDLNPKAVAFCNRRMRRHGFADAAFYGDISTDLKLGTPVDAAFNLISSFCHLTEKNQAENHLRLVADSLRPGGLYLLGFHLKPRGIAECESESWTCRRGDLRLRSQLKTVHWNQTKRLETIEFRIQAETPNKTVQLLDRFPFRTYTLSQFQNLLRKINQFEVVQTYDFSFEPIKLDQTTEDVVFALKRNGFHSPVTQRLEEE